MLVKVISIKTKDGVVKNHLEFFKSELIKELLEVNPELTSDDYEVYNLSVNTTNRVNEYDIKSFDGSDLVVKTSLDLDDLNKVFQFVAKVDPTDSQLYDIMSIVDKRATLKVRKSPYINLNDSSFMTKAAR